MLSLRGVWINYAVNEFQLRPQLWLRLTNCLPSMQKLAAKTLTTAARHIRRQETAKPLLDDIRSKIEAAQSAALPSSALSKACQYTLALWKKLTRFLEYPELELSTNLAENSMRPVALGRKNWLHISNPQEGPKVAAILSVVGSCRRLQVPVRDYFSNL